VGGPFKLIVTSLPHQRLNLIVTVIFGVFSINHMSNPKPELVAGTRSYGTPENNDEWLLLM
jgi:hypothetical protein